MKTMTASAFNLIPDHKKKVIDGIPYIERWNFALRRKSAILGETLDAEQLRVFPLRELVPVQIVPEPSEEARREWSLQSLDAEWLPGRFPQPLASALYKPIQAPWSPSPGSEEWDRAWHQIEKKYGSPTCENPDDGSTWQFMGTEVAVPLDSSDGSEPVLFHCFRHRSFPPAPGSAAQSGVRVYEWIRASEGWVRKHFFEDRIMIS